MKGLVYVFSLHLSAALGGSQVGAECPQLLLQTLPRERQRLTRSPPHCQSWDRPQPRLCLGLPLGPIVPTWAFFSSSWMQVTAFVFLPGQLVPQPQGPLSSPGTPCTSLATGRHRTLFEAQLCALRAPGWGRQWYLHPPLLWTLTFSSDLHLLHFRFGPVFPTC